MPIIRNKRRHHSEPADIKKIEREYYEQPYVCEFDSLDEMSRFCVRILYPFRSVCVYGGSGFPNQAVLPTPAGYPTIQLSSDTVYLETTP